MKTTVILIALCSYCMVSASSFAPPTLPRHATASSSPIATAMTVESASEQQSDSQTVSPILSSEETSLQLLDESLLFNSSAASELLTEIRTMRASASQEEVDAYLNNLLAAVDNDMHAPIWTRIRLMGRFSRRARRASLSRVLTMSTPNEEEGEGMDEEQRRRRRSLVLLIRALSEEDEDAPRVPNVLKLEKAARREARSKVQTQDMEQRMPEGLETPKYSVLASRKGFEIRKYEPFSVCSVAMNKPRPSEKSKTDAKISNPQLAGASAFGALAGYLFGKNQESTAMKMTTPVLSTGDGEERQMSFVLPSEFWKEDGLDSAPKPFDESGVVLERKQGDERAVVMFGGFAGKKDVEERTKQLLDGLARDREWSAEQGATVTLAQYNDPFTPPWKRRNEVSVKVIREN